MVGKMEIPSDGWVKVLRGRCDPQWLLAKKSPTKTDSETHRGQWQHKSQKNQDKVRSLAALPCGVPRKSVSLCVPTQRFNSVAKWSVGKVEAIKKDFKKVQEVARERPIAELVKDCSSAPPDV